MEIKNDTIFQIKSKVLLYRNQKYFKIFRNIFITNTLEIISSKNKVHMVSNQTINETTNNAKEKKSLWEVIEKNIKKEKEIIDYDLNNYKPRSNEENEDDYFLDYLYNQTNLIQVNNIVYSYLNKIAIIKLNKLLSISNKDKIPLINLMKIYLGLCSENFMSLRKVNNTITIGRNSQKILIKKITKRYKTNEKTNQNRNALLNEDNKSNNKIPLIKLKFEKKLSIDKLSDSIKRTLSMNQSNINEENEKQKNNSNSEYDDVIYEQLKKSISNLTKKNKSINSKILYSSSFTRLFIGETDKESIREKYLSNFEIKKERKLDKNKDKNLSSIYLKVFLNRLEQNKKNQLPVLEKGVESILLKFKKNQEIIDKFTRLKHRNLNSNFHNLFYDKLKRLNKTATKVKKMNFFNNVKKEIYAYRNALSKDHYQKKHLESINVAKTPNQLIKPILDKKKLLDLNALKFDNGNKTTKYNNLYNDKINYKYKENEKLKSINEYKHNSNLNNYFNQNVERNDSIKLIKEKKIKPKSYIKKKIIINSNKYNDIDNDNDFLMTSGNLTARANGENNYNFWKNIQINRNCEGKIKNNVINYITRDDLFFENI